MGEMGRSGRASPSTSTGSSLRSRVSKLSSSRARLPLVPLWSRVGDNAAGERRLDVGNYIPLAQAHGG